MGYNGGLPYPLIKNVPLAAGSMTPGISPLKGILLLDSLIHPPVL